jgi:hypothetical protein
VSSIGWWLCLTAPKGDSSSVLRFASRHASADVCLSGESSGFVRGTKLTDPVPSVTTLARWRQTVTKKAGKHGQITGYSVLSGIQNP